MYIDKRKTKIELKNLTEEELKNFMVDIGEKKFRGTQIFSWINKGVDLEDMGNIPKSLKEILREKSTIGKVSVYKKLESKIDRTKKYLIELYDKNIIETVAMEYEDRLTVCISNQVGCRMGCRFCASTIDGLYRNLEPWEMIEQIRVVQKDIGKRVSNIVLMGSGEPLDNYDNTVKFLELVNEKNGLNIGYRHITLSTCGLVERIYDLADLKIPINLAISLHSPFDDERQEIMPVAKKYSIADILKSCRYYIKNTNRRISFEYSLIKGKNDSKKDAMRLVELLHGMLVHVNLIPINPISERDFEKPDIEYIQRFKGYLEKNNIPVSIRNSMGSDIEGACGQLRRKVISQDKEA